MQNVGTHPLIFQFSKSGIKTVELYFEQVPGNIVACNPRRTHWELSYYNIVLIEVQISFYPDALIEEICQVAS